MDLKLRQAKRLFNFHSLMTFLAPINFSNSLKDASLQENFLTLESAEKFAIQIYFPHSPFVC